MANINCVRFIVTDRTRCRPRWAGRGVSALAGLAIAVAAPSTGVALAQQTQPQDIPNADPAFPFSKEIEAFARANAAGPAVSDATLFLGSSSIRLWDIAGSFADRGTVNRGFGGATTPDVLRYYKRLLPPLPPRAIIVYVGENDLAGGASPDKVANDILTLMKRLRADYPRARIVCLSLKPSPIRWTLWPRIMAVNTAVAARRKAEKFDYLDVGTALLAPDGLPDASLFLQDGLHMNPRGYQRWTGLVDAWLDGAQAQES